MAKIGKFLKEAQHEFKRVNWPTRKETIRYTLFVVGISVGIALYLGLLDYIFAEVLKIVI